MPVLSSFGGPITLRQTLFIRIFSNFSKAKVMSELVTDSELAQARSDPIFRQQFLARNLARLLEALKLVRRVNSRDPKTERQIKEGGDLAVKFATGYKIAMTDHVSEQEWRIHSCVWRPLRRCFTLPFCENSL
jgi:hypothetical protein